MLVPHSCLLEFPDDDGDDGPCQLVPICVHALRLCISRDDLGPESLLAQVNVERTEESLIVNGIYVSQSEGY